MTKGAVTGFPKLIRGIPLGFLYNLHRKTLEAKTKNSGQALDNSLARPRCKMIFG